MNTNIASKFDNNISLIRKATPVLELVEGSTADTRGVMLTLDNVEHFFDGKTSVYENTRMFGLDKVQQRFMDSTLLIGEDDELLDYRLGGYNGIVHSDQTIESFIKHLGTKVARVDGMLMMSSQSSPIDVKSAEHILGAGGHGSIHVDFGWSPFMTDLRSLVRHIRLICENGAKLSHTLLQNNVRVVNDWERHIDIARTVLSNRTETLLDKRLEQMFHTAAPMSLVDRVRQHAEIRLDNPELIASQRLMLRSLMDVTDVVTHGNGVIEQTHMDNLESRFKSRCPSHVPMYSLFNLATEMNTHTPSVGGSSTLAMDRLIGEIMFNDQEMVVGRSKLSPAFSDPEAALAYHLVA